MNSKYTRVILTTPSGRGFGRIDINCICQDDKIDFIYNNLNTDEKTRNMEQKQMKGLKRNTIDKYYTKKEIAELCLSRVKTYIEIQHDDIIIEPSAGNGAFIAGIKSFQCRSLFYDIEPRHEEIMKQNYLYYNHLDIKDKYKKFHIIGNPPFGRQSSIAIQFIKKSCEFCNTISFILPKSFKKDSLKKTFPLSFHLVAENDLPEKSFLVDGVEYNVPCVFQIWEKRHCNRIPNEIVEPVHFKFVKKNENPDISFRRVGVNAGKIDINIEEKSVQSHYFIQFINDKSINDNIQVLSGIQFDVNNTVGPRSISKQELICKFNPLL